MEVSIILHLSSGEPERLYNICATRLSCLETETFNDKPPSQTCGTFALPFITKRQCGVQEVAAVTVGMHA